jgi:MFS family permease
VSVAQASVTDVAAPEERPRLLGLLGAAFGFGFLAGPIIGGLTALIDRRAPFIVAAGIAAVNAAVAVRRLPETHPRRAGATATPTFSRSTAAESAPVDLQNGDRPFSRSAAAESTAGNLENESGGSGLGRLILVGFVSLVAFSGFEATFSLLVQDRFGLSESATYGVFAVIGLFLVLVQGGLVHPVHSKLGETTTIRFGLACNGLGLALVAVDAGWLVLTPGLALLIVGQGLLTPTLSSAVAARSSTARRGTNLGWQQSAGGLARVVGPAMAGALFQHVGVPAPYALGAALLLLALGLVPVAPRHELFPVVTGR